MNKKEKLINKLIQFFILASNNDADYESEKIELDNLDEARLVFEEGSVCEVEVENEHGTRFGLDELSETELTIFLYLLDPENN